MCKKVKHADGLWVSSDPAVIRHVGDAFSHGYCPECREEMQEKVDELDTLPPKRN